MNDENAGPSAVSPAPTGAAAIRVAGFGHALFAATMIALGIVGLVEGRFTAIWSGVPKGMPGRPALAYLCAAICLGSGLGLFWTRTAAVASRALLALLVLWMLLFRVPLVARDPGSSGMWWACGETAVMMAGAWVLYAWFAGGRNGGHAGFAAGATGLRVARVLYGLGLIPFGIAHFTFLERTVSMVPGWLPWHLGWAYFTGSALIVAGVAIVLGLLARLAAMLSALELTLFTLLVWIPIIATSRDPSQWNEFVDSWALTAAAWVVADSFRDAKVPYAPAATRSST